MCRGDERIVRAQRTSREPFQSKGEFSPRRRESSLVSSRIRRRISGKGRVQELVLDRDGRTDIGGLRREKEVLVMMVVVGLGGGERFWSGCGRRRMKMPQIGGREMDVLIELS